MLVDAVASFPHYRDHLQPILDALPLEMRGVMHQLGKTDVPPSRVALVAGWKDARVLDQRGIRYFYVEHGAGQTYAGDERKAVRDHPSYSGGGGARLQNVLGFICPSERVAERWTVAPAAAVGCPKMDQFYGVVPTIPRAICFTFHFRGFMCPENGTAWAHWDAHFLDIAEFIRTKGFLPFAHLHPRCEEWQWKTLRDAGFTPLATDREVFHQCGMLIADNTSLIPEFAALGRPVAYLNAPWYRREVEHGGRFWDWAKLVSTWDDPADFYDGLLDAYQLGTPSSAALASEVYATVDGSASQRAAAFIVDTLLGL